MSGRFCIRWPEFGIVTSRSQVVVQYEAGTAHFEPCLALVGRSGAGKSLFGRALAGLLPIGLFTCGEPTLERWLSSGDCIPVSHQEIAYVPQSPASALPSAITCGALLHQVIGWRQPDQGSRSDFDFHLERVGLDPATTSNLQASQLSGGMAQRFAICLALAREPKLLVLDEPTVGLDADSARRVLDLLRSLLSDGQMGAVIITHDSRVTETANERVMLERHGTTVSMRSDEGGLPG